MPFSSGRIALESKHGMLASHGIEEAYLLHLQKIVVHKVLLQVQSNFCGLAYNRAGKVQSKDCIGAELERGTTV